MVVNSDLTAATSLVDAAVRAAVASGAPRRTVAATAAAVASAAMAALRISSDGAPGTAVEKKKRRRKKKSKGMIEPPAAAGEVPVGGTGATEEWAVSTAAGACAGVHSPRASAARPLEKDNATVSPPRKVACFFKDTPDPTLSLTIGNLKNLDNQQAFRSLPPVPTFGGSVDMPGTAASVKSDRSVSITSSQLRERLGPSPVRPPYSRASSGGSMRS